MLRCKQATGKSRHCTKPLHLQEILNQHCCEGVLTLDVVPEDLPVALGTSLSESLTSLAASGHGCKVELRVARHERF